MTFHWDFVVCIEQLPYSVVFWCMLGGGSVEVYNKEFYTGPLRGETHFGMSRDAKTELGPQ